LRPIDVETVEPVIVDSPLDRALVLGVVPALFETPEVNCGAQRLRAWATATSWI
jgi:hypothetical protein